MEKDPSSPSVATQPAPPPKHGGAGPLVPALGYVLAVGAGIATISNNIRDKFYDTVSHWPEFKALKNARNKQIDGVIIDGIKAGPINNDTFHKDTRVFHDAHNELHQELLNKLGFRTDKTIGGYIKGTHQRWRALGEGKQFAILFSGAVSTGITIGSFFLLNQNAALKGKLNNIQTRIDSER